MVTHATPGVDAARCGRFVWTVRRADTAAVADAPCRAQEQSVGSLNALRDEYE